MNSGGSARRLIALGAALLLAGAAWGLSEAFAAHLTASRMMQPPPCAKKYPAPVSVNRWPLARVTLAPAGANAIRLCRYAGGNAPSPLRLIRAVLFASPHVVGALVRDLDRLPSQGPGAIACPSDDGSKIVVLIAYPGGHRVTISVGLAGCNLVTNGDLNRLAGGVGTPRPFGPQLVAWLERLAAHH